MLVFRHTATDDSQKDVYPFKFDDMSAQRQLSEKGRDMARQIGTAIKERAIPIGDIYTSRLNRAIEAGKLISDREVKPVDALTDSSNASASGMANPTGANAKAGQAVRQLVDAPPEGRHQHASWSPTRPTSRMPSARTPGTCRKAKLSSTSASSTGRGGFRRTHQACGLERESGQVTARTSGPDHTLATEGLANT